MEKPISIVSIEGNIGSGKSTVINTLKEYYKCNNKVYFLEEPVSEWIEIKDSGGKNIIEKFYEDQEHYSFSFQMMAYISRLAMLKRAIKHCKENGIKLIICERSLQTDKNVFCKMLYDQKKIDSYGYQIYNMWFEHFQEFIKISKFIYLKTDFETCFNRVKKRQRQGENEISKEYLQLNNKYHDDWLLNENDVLILDGNQDCIENPELLNNFSKQIINHITSS